MLKDKICLVTGGTSGIGQATAMGLAKLGATVVILGRDYQRGITALTEIKTQSGNPQVELMLADLASPADIRQFVQTFKQKYPQLHVLVNNAGIYLSQRTITPAGIETQFAVNYLAPFLLTNLLLELLKASAPARIINVAGEYHRKATINFDNLMFTQNYDASKASNQSKLALIMFTYTLARQLKGTGVTVNCLHPGAVATDPLSKDPHSSVLARFFYRLIKPFFLSPEKGAATSLYLATSPEVEGVTGEYFIKQKSVKSSPESYDIAVAERLWQVSTELTQQN